MILNVLKVNHLNWIMAHFGFLVYKYLQKLSMEWSSFPYCIKITYRYMMWKLLFFSVLENLSYINHIKNANFEKFTYSFDLKNYYS